MDSEENPNSAPFKRKTEEEPIIPLKKSKVVDKGQTHSTPKKSHRKSINCLGTELDGNYWQIDLNSPRRSKFQSQQSQQPQLNTKIANDSDLILLSEKPNSHLTHIDEKSSVISQMKLHTKSEESQNKHRNKLQEKFEPLIAHSEKTEKTKAEENSNENGAEKNKNTETDIPIWQKSVGNGIGLDGSYWAIDPHSARTRRKIEPLIISFKKYISKPPRKLTEQELEIRKQKQLIYAEKMKQISIEEKKQREQTIIEKEKEFFGFEIVPGVFLGTKLAAKNSEFFSKSNIKSVINVTKTVPNYFETEVNYMRIPIEDDSSFKLEPYFQSAFQFIFDNQKQGSVFVHCKLGRSRSPALMIAFLMFSSGLSLDDAFEFVETRRNSRLVINLGLYNELLGFQEQCENKLEENKEK